MCGGEGRQGGSEEQGHDKVISQCQVLTLLTVYLGATVHRFAVVPAPYSLPISVCKVINRAGQGQEQSGKVTGTIS